MTPREIQICERVYHIRTQIAKWSQPDLARALGITQNQLAGVEYKRAPLRFSMAKFFCEKFDVNQRWLALGVKPVQPKFDVPMEYSFLVKPNSLYSAVFDGWLDGQTKQIEDSLIEMVGEDNFRTGNFDDAIFSHVRPGSEAPVQSLVFYVKKVVALQLNQLPDDLRLKYGNALLKATESFELKHSKRIAQTQSPAERKFLVDTGGLKENALTETSKASKLVGEVKIAPQWPTLKKRLQKATREIGAKPALAKILNVDPTQISQWLSESQSAREPGGDYALRMLKWVELQER